MAAIGLLLDYHWIIGGPTVVNWANLGFLLDLRSSIGLFVVNGGRSGGPTAVNWVMIRLLLGDKWWTYGAQLGSD